LLIVSRTHVAGVLRSALPPVVIGLIAGSISIGRLLLANPTAITETLWAEDGFHPQCVVNEGFLRCLEEPYNGFMHLVPRLIAGVVALVPIDEWALAANLFAAALAGLVAGGMFVRTRRAHVSPEIAVVLALLVVIHSSLSAESVNSYANSYILLAYLLTVLCLFPGVLETSPATFVGFTAALGVLSLPSIVVVVPLAVIIRKRPWSIRQVRVLTVVSGVAIAVQSIAVFARLGERTTTLDRASIALWLRLTPARLFRSITNLDMPTTVTELLRFDVSAEAALLALLPVFVCCGAVLLRGRAHFRSAAAMVVAGTLLSVLPSVVFGAIERYFVWLQMSVAAAVVTALAGLRFSRRWRAGILLLWLVPMAPSLTASDFRAGAEFPWSVYVEESRSRCRTEGVGRVPIRFAPNNWPTDAGRWETGVSDIDCDALVER
jgi:hypothetical protein